MPSRHKKSSKKAKMPANAGELKKYSEELKTPMDEKVVQFVTSLVESRWEPYFARPKSDLFGFYLICRWAAKDNMWVILYAGRGLVSSCVSGHFNSHKREPLSHYLTSFHKQDRSQIWLKWAKDPYYPYEGIALDDILTCLAELYSSIGERPAFNLDLEVEEVKQKKEEKKEEEELPDDFTIVPDWKPRNKKKTARS